MKAAWFDRTGDLSYLQMVDLETPIPGAHELLVQIAAAAVNPSDVKNIQGLMHHTTLPRIPGRDFAGTVVQGPAAWMGREVWGSGGDLGFTRDGAHAEYLRLPQEAVLAKPPTLSSEEAAAIGVPFLTAWAALVEAGQMQPSDIVAIIGAAGAVGNAAVQIARWKGVSVIGVIRKPEQADGLAALGAQPLIVTAPETLRDAVKKATGGQGASLILDTVGGILLDSSLHALAPQGRLMTVTTPHPRVEIDVLDFYRRELTLRGINTLRWDAAAGAQRLAQIASGFADGSLQPPQIAARYPLSQALAAYAAVQQGQGKILLIPDAKADKPRLPG